MVFSSLLQASPIPFSPIVRNYSVSDYNAGIQNWAIAQDERGVMYFGNNSGLLEFDGSAWRLYELPTKGIVRAIYISEDGRIYVGSYEEFGYFVRTPYDTLEYHSLKNKGKILRFIMTKSGILLAFKEKLYFNHSVLSFFIMEIR